MNFFYRKKRFFLTIFCVAFAFFLFLNIPAFPSVPPDTYGVTFSPWQATSFGLDWKETYAALLDDLGVSRFRLSAYWDMVEPEKDRFVFDDLDYQINEAQKRGATVLLAIGRKLPRWPECHDPVWIKGATLPKMKEEISAYIMAVMERYKDHPAIWGWQVENELFFPFGTCPALHTGQFLAQEVKLVRSYSSKPIVISDAGEWSTWIVAASYGDIVGSSLYRESWNDYLAYIPFPIQPGYYQARAFLIEKFLGRKVIFTEVQLEPWGPKAAQNMTPQEALQYMSVDKFHANIEFANRVGFSDVYLWGAEWWYWMKKQGDPSIWNAAKEVFGESRL